MTVDYMSSEHSVSEDNISGDDSSGDEDAPRRKVLCRRPLTWRSENLNSLFAQLDRKNKIRQSQKSQSMMMKRRDDPLQSKRHQMMLLNLPCYKDMVKAFRKR